MIQVTKSFFWRKWYFNKKIWQGFDKSDVALQLLKFYYKKVYVTRVACMETKNKKLN